MTRLNNESLSSSSSSSSPSSSSLSTSSCSMSTIDTADITIASMVSATETANPVSPTLASKLLPRMVANNVEVSLIGQPCGQHSSYTFYKAFSYRRLPNQLERVLMLGEFFFVRISPHDDPCIGELQLLWQDHHNNQLLSSTRLYFLPEQTPDGRLSHHGQHEVIAAQDKVILKLTDLVSWITHQVDWIAGIRYKWKPPTLLHCTINHNDKENTNNNNNNTNTNTNTNINSNDIKSINNGTNDDDNDNHANETKSNEKNHQILSSLAFIHNQNVIPPNGIGPFLTLQRYIHDQCKIRSNDISAYSYYRSFACSRVDFTDIIPYKLKSNELQDDLSKVVVLSYARYCRLRSLLKRIECKEDELLSKQIVQDILADLGIPQQRINYVNIVFCRDTFNHEALLNNDLNCDHLAPRLKGRPRKRIKNKSTVRASSPESISSEETFSPRRSRRSAATTSYYGQNNQSNQALTFDNRKKKKKSKQTSSNKGKRNNERMGNDVMMVEIKSSIENNNDNSSNKNDCNLDVEDQDSKNNNNKIDIDIDSNFENDHNENKHIDKKIEMENKSKSNDDNKKNGNDNDNNNNDGRQNSIDNDDNNIKMTSLTTTAKKKKKNDNGGGGVVKNSVDANNNINKKRNRKKRNDRKANQIMLQHFTKETFLKQLNDFMKKRQTPIQRVPNLGFKKIDLYLFFIRAIKYGGYEMITKKKLWKKLYVEMGGDKGSTSAATSTRKNYEKLLLAFENHLKEKKENIECLNKIVNTSHDNSDTDDMDDVLSNFTMSSESDNNINNNDNNDLVLSSADGNENDANEVVSKADSNIECLMEVEKGITKPSMSLSNKCELSSESGKEEQQNSIKNAIVIATGSNDIKSIPLVDDDSDEKKIDDKQTESDNNNDNVDSVDDEKIKVNNMAIKDNLNQLKLMNLNGNVNECSHIDSDHSQQPDQLVKRIKLENGEDNNNNNNQYISAKQSSNGLAHSSINLTSTNKNSSNNNNVLYSNFNSHIKMTALVHPTQRKFSNTSSNNNNNNNNHHHHHHYHHKTSNNQNNSKFNNINNNNINNDNDVYDFSDDYNSDRTDMEILLLKSFKDKNNDFNYDQQHQNNNNHHHLHSSAILNSNTSSKAMHSISDLINTKTELIDQKNFEMNDCQKAVKKRRNFFENSFSLPKPVENPKNFLSQGLVEEFKKKVPTPAHQCNSLIGEQNSRTHNEEILDLSVKNSNGILLDLTIKNKFNTTEESNKSNVNEKFSQYPKHQPHAKQIINKMDQVNSIPSSRVNETFLETISSKRKSKTNKPRAKSPKSPVTNTNSIPSIPDYNPKLPQFIGSHTHLWPSFSSFPYMNNIMVAPPPAPLTISIPNNDISTFMANESTIPDSFYTNILESRSNQLDSLTSQIRNLIEQNQILMNTNHASNYHFVNLFN